MTAQVTARPGMSRINRMMVAPQPISMSSECAPITSKRWIPASPPLVESLSIPSDKRGCTFPDGPWPLAACMHFVEILVILDGIHWSPETTVSIAEELAFLRKALERGFDELVALLHVVEQLRPQHEVPTVQPDFCFGASLDAIDGVPFLPL